MTWARTTRCSAAHASRVLIAHVSSFLSLVSFFLSLLCRTYVNLLPSFVHSGFQTTLRRAERTLARAAFVPAVFPLEHIQVSSSSGEDAVRGRLRFTFAQFEQIGHVCMDIQNAYDWSYVGETFLRNRWKKRGPVPLLTNSSKNLFLCHPRPN